MFPHLQSSLRFSADATVLRDQQHQEKARENRASQSTRLRHDLRDASEIERVGYRLRLPWQNSSQAGIQLGVVVHIHD